MKKKMLFCLLTSLIVTSCTKNPSAEPSVQQTQEPSQTPTIEQTIEPTQVPTNEPTIEPTPEKEYYAVINSSNDLVYIYGIVGETFDLNQIDCSRIFNGTITYKIENENKGIQIENTNLILNEKGVYKVSAYNKRTKLYEILISVNDIDENRYAMPTDLNLSDYILHSGNKNNITVSDDKITISCLNSSDWHRITYSLPNEFSTNYTVECDVTFKETTDVRRWFGIVFRDQETSSKKYPYYQFDIRKNTSAVDAIEVTNVYADNNQYTYAHTSSWDNGGFGNLTSADVVHMKLTVRDRLLLCELASGNYTTSFETYLSNISSGNFGFQCSSSIVEIENIKVSLDKETKISSLADPTESIVNIYDNTIDAMLPNIIASGQSTDEIYGVGADVQQLYVKVKNETLYNLNDAEMDLTLNDLFLETRSAYIPNLHIEDSKTLNYVNDVCSSFAMSDLVIWSSNDEILTLARKLMPYARLGYVPTNLTKFETFDEIGVVCRKAGSLYANLILIDSNLLNKENVNKSLGLGYSIVANAKNGEAYSVLDGALDGCKLILANFNESVQQQVETLYDPSIFNLNEKSSLISNQTHSLLSIPYATGHRGSGNTPGNQSCNYPENTIESFEYAYESGARAVEIDIHLTKDNKLAIIHNDKTDEYTDSLHKYTVATSTMEALSKIPLKTPNGQITYDYHIPSYDELLIALDDEKYKDKTMVVEIKDGKVETGKLAIEIAKQYGWYNRITFITFSASLAKSLRDYDPGVQVSYLNTVYRNNNEEFWTSFDSYLATGVGLASQYSTVSQEAIQESNARGYIYWLWTFNKTDNTTILNHILNGNMAFTTNYVQFFTNNKYKLVYEDTISLQKGESKLLSANSVTYNNTVTTEDDVEIIVLSNNATTNGNQITRTSDGTIYAIIKHQTTWDLGGAAANFYIYSDIIAIN